MKKNKYDYAFRVSFKTWRAVRKIKKEKHLKNADDVILHLIKSYESVENPQPNFTDLVKAIKKELDNEDNSTKD